MNININYYNVLQLSNQATKEDIKKSFRNLSKLYHPDKNPNSENKFKDISEAYSILSNDKNKEQYDLNSIHGKNYFVPPEELFKDYQEFKESLDINMNLIITLKDIYSGDPIKITYNRYVACEDCEWTGFDRSGFSDECDICDGTGTYQHETCNYCKGKGKIYSETCKTCNGEKIILEKTNFYLTGVKDIKKSETKYIKEYGHQSRYYELKKGTLILNIVYEPIKNYIIKDNILIYLMDLHYEDAIKGNKIKYKHLDDIEYDITIPEKTKDKEYVQIKNMGLLEKERGDLYLKINIIIDYEKLNTKKIIEK